MGAVLWVSNLFGENNSEIYTAVVSVGYII